MKSEVVAVPFPAPNRDAGKLFLLEEQPATVMEKWWLRLIIAAKGTAAEVPPEVAAMGIVGICIRGLNSFLRADVDPDKLEPLLDQMLSWIKIVRDPKHPEVATTIVSADDIRELPTLLWLRSEVLRIHINFSIYDGLSTLISLVLEPKPQGSPST
jgi:hypothetical protein